GACVTTSCRTRWRRPASPPTAGRDVSASYSPERARRQEIPPYPTDFSRIELAGRLLVEGPTLLPGSSRGLRRRLGRGPIIAFRAITLKARKRPVCRSVSLDYPVP